MRSNTLLFGWFLGGIATATLAAACGGGGGDAGGATNVGNGHAGGSADAGSDADASTDGAGGGLGLDGGGDVQATLTIDPADPVLQATGAPITLQLEAKLNGGSEPSGVVWLTDDVTVGALSPTGLFSSGGLITGKTTVTAQYGALSATTTVTVKVNATDNSGNVSAGDQALLRTGGSDDASFRWLYPYDATVWPRGLASPVLQLAGAAADSVRVAVDFGDFHYEGFFAGADPVRATLPQPVWDAIGASASGTDKVQVSVSKLSAGKATGPATESWTIAQGKLKGTVYYNTYHSKLTGTGAVMRIRPGADADVLIGGCTVCHSVSANGNRLAAGVSWDTDNPVDSSTFDLDPNGGAAPRVTDPDGRKFSFAALTPDGAWAVSNGGVNSSPIRGLAGDFPTKLWDAATGLEVSAPSLSSAVTYAMTPAFSPDGKKLAFNWWDKSQGHSLAVLDFDGAQSPPAFSAPTEVVANPNATVAWPSFLPDGTGVVYHEGDAFDTGKFGAQPSYANLRLVDLANGNATSSLDALNGVANGATYLPYGDAEEANSNYEPTVLPVAVGGYYWVVFTSRRCYGNTIAPGGTEPGGDNRWGTYINSTETPSIRKKLWVAAIDINATPGADRSHPAFYLPGQELEAGNMRAFAALDPCKADGSTCDSAAECCGGFCRQTGTDEGGAPLLECVPPPGGCSNEDEKCTTAGDCCGAVQGYGCINGRCAQPSPH